MNTTINSVNALISAKKAAVAVKAEPKKAVEKEQQTEAYSSTYSNAARSMALAGIKHTGYANGAKEVAPKKSTVASANYLEGIQAKVVRETTGDEANQWWQEEMNYDNPPYLPKSKVQEIELEDDTKFVRVYDGVNSGMFGGWVMKAQDIEGLSPKEIQDKFALPQTPCKMCDVMIQKGTKMRTGLCNPLDGWGKGGGTQFDLMGQRVGEFGNERELPT